MHPLFQQASQLTHDVIGAAIEVHKELGPGLLESIYEWSLTVELESRGHHVQSQADVVVRYKQSQREFPLRFDLLVDQCLFVEVKAAEAILTHPQGTIAQLHEIAKYSIGSRCQFPRTQTSRRSIPANPPRRKSGVSHFKKRKYSAKQSTLFPSVQ
jgi:GxxExxY protein